MSDETEKTYSRREALRAVGKYSVAMAGASVIALSAEEAAAQAACSRKNPPWWCQNGGNPGNGGGGSNSTGTGNGNGNGKGKGLLTAPGQQPDFTTFN